MNTISTTAGTSQGNNESVTNQTNNQQPGGRGFITGAVTGIGQGIKNNWYYIIIVIGVLAGAWVGVNYLKTRKSGVSRQININKPLIKKLGNINIAQVTCSSCGKTNARWRRFCSHCGKSLKFS